MRVVCVCVGGQILEDEFQGDFFSFVHPVYYIG